MYLMVETIRVQTEDDRPEWRSAREAFKNELGVCVCVWNTQSYNLVPLQPTQRCCLWPLTPQVRLCTMESPLPCSSSPWWPSSAAWMPHTSPWRKCSCSSGRQYWSVHITALTDDVHECVYLHVLHLWARCCLFTNIWQPVSASNTLSSSSPWEVLRSSRRWRCGAESAWACPRCQRTASRWSGPWEQPHPQPLPWSSLNSSSSRREAVAAAGYAPPPLPIQLLTFNCFSLTTNAVTFDKGAWQHSIHVRDLSLGCIFGADVSPSVVYSSFSSITVTQRKSVCHL